MLLHGVVLVKMTRAPEPIDDTDDEPEGPKEGEDEEEEKAPGPREVTTTDWKLVNENKPIWTRKPTTQGGIPWPNPRISLDCIVVVLHRE